MKRRFLFMLLAALTCVGANAAILKANNFLAPSAATGTAGKTVEVNILMSNDQKISIWQTNLVLPTGITLVKAEAADKWTDEVKVDGNKVFSETETAVGAGKEAVVAKLTLQIDATVAAGEYDIVFEGTVMTTDEGKIITQETTRTAKLTVEPAEEKITGDLTGDTKVNIADVTALLTIIANQGTVDQYPDADLTGDSKINIADLTAVLTIIANQAATE
jgi:hypothetical protein